MPLALRKIQTFMTPCPHFVIDGVFEQEFYDDFVRAIPPMSSSSPMPAGETGTMSIEEFSEVGPRNAELGALMADDLTHLTDEAIGLLRGLMAEAANLDQYRAFAMMCGGLDWEIPEHYRLRERGQAFQLPPHTDGPYFAGTYLLYLPTSDVDRLNGTAFVRPEPPGAVDLTATFFQMWPRHRGWALEKMIDYIPNRVVGFLNTPFSLHANYPFELMSRRITIAVTPKLTDESIRALYATLPESYRQITAKPKILEAILAGVDTLAERRRAPEGAFSFLNG